MWPDAACGWYIGHPEKRSILDQLLCHWLQSAWIFCLHHSDGAFNRLHVLPKGLHVSVHLPVRYPNHCALCRDKRSHMWQEHNQGNLSHATINLNILHLADEDSSASSNLLCINALSRGIGSSDNGYAAYTHIWRSTFLQSRGKTEIA